MLKVSAGDFQRNIGLYQDMALSQAVVITRNGRDRTVLIATEEYQRLKQRDRQVLTAGQLSAQDVTAIAAAEPAADAFLYDHEMTR